MCALRPEEDIGYTATSLYLTSGSHQKTPQHWGYRLTYGHTQLLNMSAEDLNSGHCACSVSSLFFFFNNLFRVIL